METNYAVTNDETPHSMLEVLLTNLSRSHMKCHLYRMMYVGEHNLEFESIQDVLKYEVEKANLDERDETLFGLYLHYSRHFILTVEGSEEAILRHAEMLKSHEKLGSASLGDTRVLIMLRVNQRMLRSPWQSLQTSEVCESPTGMENAQVGEPSTTEEFQVWQQARVCVAKIHRLAGVLASREASQQDGPLTDKSLLPEQWAVAKLLQEPLLLSVHEFLRRAVSPPPALRHDDHTWPPDDCI